MPFQQTKPEIVFTGPESSGKTTLTQSVAGALGEGWAPEFARSYLAHLGRPYRRDDLQPIAAGQRAWQRWHAEHSAIQFCLCDTDWTVLQVWEYYRFVGEGPLSLMQTTDFQWRKGWADPHLADLYLLCAPDFPWQPDPLREHPDERGALFSRYEKLLADSGVPCLLLTGDPDTRLATALAAIRQL